MLKLSAKPAAADAAGEAAHDAEAGKLLEGVKAGNAAINGSRDVLLPKESLLGNGHPSAQKLVL